MNVSERLHELYGADRRVRVLSRQIVSVLPRDVSILDVGCGDGEIDQLVGELREDVDIRGIDVLVRPDAKIPVKEFDGMEIPYPDDSFDGVVFVDVLHHSDDAKKLLGEARRVARSFIVIKDHGRISRVPDPALHGRRRQRALRGSPALQLLDT